MMKDIHYSYSQRKLLNEIEDAGFEGLYDFFFMPVDTKNYVNRGVAYLNFEALEDAERFYLYFNSKALKEDPSYIVRIMPADIQGFETNAERYCKLFKKSIRGPHAKPIFYRPLPAHLVGHLPVEDRHASDRMKGKGWRQRNDASDLMKGKGLRQRNDDADEPREAKAVNAWLPRGQPRDPPNLKRLRNKSQKQHVLQLPGYMGQQQFPAFHGDTSYINQIPVVDSFGYLACGSTWSNNNCGHFGVMSSEGQCDAILQALQMNVAAGLVPGVGLPPGLM